MLSQEETASSNIDQILAAEEPPLTQTDVDETQEFVIEQPDGPPTITEYKCPLR